MKQNAQLLCSLEVHFVSDDVSYGHFYSTLFVSLVWWNGQGCFLFLVKGCQMVRRAVIYLRTASEPQGEKSSTVEQEADCQTLAKQKGLQVVCVYRDVQKYRVGNRIVEPSGSRSDRPGPMAMLKDACRDEFDVSIAWREDRLYRGIRAMLMVLETIQAYGIEILLAKESFDSKVAPIRARAARRNWME
jgi:hypothetical protein